MISGSAELSEVEIFPSCMVTILIDIIIMYS